MNNKLFICILIFGGLLLISSCKSYELRPEAQGVRVWIMAQEYDSLLQSIQSNSQNKNSVFSKCKFLGQAPETEWNTNPYRNISNRDLENDIKNQAARNGANVVFCNNSTVCKSGLMYHCENVDLILVAQKEIDEREAEKLKAAREKEEKELYTKPHHWVTCVASGYTQMPPSIVQSILETNFPPKAFDSENACADNASYLTQVGSQFGIKCKCKYVKLSR